MKDENRFASLSRREEEVVASLLQGRSNKQIALSLGVSERTVEFHFKNIYAKMQVASRVELVLKLGTIGGISENPVESTAVRGSENVHNGNQPVVQGRWAQSLRNTVSLIHQEVAMTLRIILEDLGNSLRRHPLLFSLILFLTVSTTVRYTIFNIGLYFWVSYIVLGLLLGTGCIYFGLAWSNIVAGKIRFHPLTIIMITALIPLLVAGLDEIFLYTIVKNTGTISVTLADLSNTAAWLISPEGNLYLSTTRSIFSDDLWFLAMIYLLSLFLAGALSNKWFKRKDLTPV
jgi:DNA-binding CsgD family transcriptional regulator